MLRALQRGENLSLPQSRPIRSIGARCHELRIVDEEINWRIVYRVDPDAIVSLEIFEKKTNRTPKSVTDVCKKRIKDYEL